MKKRLLCILLTVCLLLCCIPASVSAADANQCGHEVTWSFSESSGRLTISGKNSMYNSMDSWGWESFAEKITSINITSGVTSIGSFAFADLINLTSVSLPDTLKYIEHYAFAGCTKLASITLPNSLTYIGDYAFADCVALKSIKLPAKVSYLGAMPFLGCTALEKIKVSSNNEWLSSDSQGVLLNKDQTILYMAPNGLKGSYWVPSAVKKIYSYAFLGCEKLTEVHLNYAADSIMPGAFAGAPNLKSVWANQNSQIYASDSEGALYSKNMQTLYFAPATISGHYTVREGVKTIEQAAFYGCSNMTDVTLPNTLQNIRKEAFAASGLTQITFPESIATVGEYAFAYCTSLTKVEFPVKGVGIGRYAFYACICLESIQMPLLYGIPAYCFYGCISLSDFKLGSEGISEVGQYSFYGCVSLPDFEFPDNLIYLRSYAFYGCASLKNLDLNNVISVDSYAFGQCISLEKLRFNPPVHDVSFGNYAFENCSNLRELYFECGISNVEDKSFHSVTADAYYPTNSNDDWDNYKLRDYGGDITWIPYTYVCQEHNWRSWNTDDFTGKVIYRRNCSMCGTYQREYHLIESSAIVTTQRDSAKTLEHILLTHRIPQDHYDVVLPEAMSNLADPQTAPRLEVALPTGSTATVTIPLEEGTGSVYVYRLYDDGSFDRAWDAVRTEDGIVLTLEQNCSVLISEAKYHTFTDLDTSKFYYDAVLWAFENGITKGTSATKFSPENSCTRKQIVTFLWRAAGCPEPASMENPFADVKHDQFEKAILWAYYAGITKGTSATEFSPENPCTRKQIVTFLWRAAGCPEAESMENPFTDVKHDQFEKAILWAYYEGITTGKTATTFLPETTCTRGQIVTFLYRSYN